MSIDIGAFLFLCPWPEQPLTSATATRRALSKNSVRASPSQALPGGSRFAPAVVVAANYLIVNALLNPSTPKSG